VRNVNEYPADLQALKPSFRCCRHGRVVVPDVLGFIVAWYGLYFPDDPLSHVVQSQLQEKENEKIAGRVDEIFAHARAKEVRAPTSASSVRTRLFTMLSCIVECGPRGLTGAQVLKYVFLEFLARPDPASAKLALNGLLAFKSPTLTLYKDNLTALSDEGTLREELTRFRETFDSSSEGATIEAEHRKELVPIVVRLLFGRLLSRGIRGRIASRWPPKARRAAVLSFLAGLQPDELGYLVALMLRSFKPSVVLLNAISGDSVFTELLQLSADDMKCVGLSKKTGFLKLAMDAVKQLGVRLLPYVDAMSHVLLLLLDETAGDTMGRQMPNGGEAGLEQDEIGGSDEEGSAIADIESSTTLRTLCLHTWAEFMVAFSSDHDFVALGARFWRPLLVPLENLPGSCVGASNPPALLALIRKMAEHPVHLAGLLAVGDGGLSQSTQPLVAALRCMDVGGGSPTVVDCCLSIMEVLVAHNGGQLILPHVGLIIEIFSKRLGIGKDDREHGDDGEKLLGKGTISRELAVLQSIAELLRDCDDSTSLPVSAAENLGGALLRCLSRQQRELRKSRLEDIDEGPILSVMLAYAALVPRMGDGRRAWGHLSRLLGTHGSKMGFGLPFPRNALVAALSVAAERPDLAQAGAGRSMLVLKDLNAHDPESLEDIDFDRVVPAFNQLTDGAGWMEIVAATETPSSLGSQPFGGLALGAVAHHCLFMLHTTEVAVRGAASAALCRLARVVGAEMKQPGDAWYSVLQAVLLPGLRNGMGSPDQGARKCYMSVLGAVVQWVSDTQGAAVPTDLSLLSRPDDPEGDFFSNVTHMQLHRRARGMLTMRKHASDFSPATITHYLIPLALHPLHESLVSKAKPGEHTLLTEATAALAGLAAVLPWSHYTRCVRELMIQVKHSPGDRDRPLANALCAVLDEWHFEVVKPPTREDVEQVSQGSELVEIESDSGQDGDRAAERGAVWQILTSRLIPGLKGFMTVQKAASDGAGSKENVVRANVAIALVKLLRLLPFEDLEAQLGPVILSVCQTLRSRDSSVRDAARLALGRMVASLGPGHAGTVFDVLQTCLPSDGYQLHVRTYTLATVIRTIEEGGYAPPEAMSLDAFKGEITSDEANNVLLNRPAFDVALPAAVSMLCDDLFGVGAEARRAAAGGHEVSHVSKTKEAKGAKALECIEAMARMALFRPTHSLACPDDPMTASSAHALTTPFLLRLSG
jgi:U3 small nucleolar RNA-associated protein 20